MGERLIIRSVLREPLCKQVIQWHRMVTYQVRHLSVQGSENSLVGRDKRRLVAVASCQVLRGDYRNGVTRFTLHQQDLRVVIREIATFHHLADERPEFQGLVRSLVIQHQVELQHLASLLDKE